MSGTTKFEAFGHLGGDMYSSVSHTREIGTAQIVEIAPAGTHWERYHYANGGFTRVKKVYLTTGEVLLVKDV